MGTYIALTVLGIILLGIAFELGQHRGWRRGWDARGGPPPAEIIPRISALDLATPALRRVEESLRQVVSDSRARIEAAGIDTTRMGDPPGVGALPPIDELFPVPPLPLPAIIQDQDAAQAAANVFNALHQRGCLTFSFSWTPTAVCRLIEDTLTRRSH